MGVSVLDPFISCHAPTYRSSSDNSHIVKGSPVELQLVGCTHEEDAVLTMRSIVADALAAAKGQ
jgi:hypothetical protein